MEFLVSGVALKLGFIAVRNRTQEEIDSNMSAEKARLAEIQFFESTPELRAIQSESKGTQELSKQLTRIQRVFLTNWLESMVIISS